MAENEEESESLYHLGDFPTEPEEEHIELEELTEMEKNLNQIWVTSHNSRMHRVRSGDKEVGRFEAKLDFKKHLLKGELVQAVRVAEDFWDKDDASLVADMYNKQLMQATFNTIKAKVKNL